MSSRCRCRCSRRPACRAASRPAPPSPHCVPHSASYRHHGRKLSPPTARADQRYRGEPCSFRRSVRVAHSWSTPPRAPSSQVSSLCGAHFLGHLSPQHEMTGLAVGPCCTAVAHRTFPAAPFAASAGGRSMDAWHPPFITPRTTTPITVRRGVMLSPPHSPPRVPAVRKRQTRHERAGRAWTHHGCSPYRPVAQTGGVGGGAQGDRVCVGRVVMGLTTRAARRIHPKLSV